MSGKLVAVCGATGQQGGAVVEALLGLGGFTVRGLTRDPSSPSSLKLASKGVEVVKADCEDPASLEAAFQGADAVFGVTDFFAGCGLDPVRELNQGKNLVNAAKAAGVGHFVWSTLEETREVTKGVLEPISGSYTVPHCDAKAEVEEYLKQQLPGKGTCVMGSLFVENLLPGGPMGPTRQSDGSYGIVWPYGNAKLSWCSTADLGNVVAAVIAGGPKQFGDKTVPVAGDHLTWPEVAEALTKLTGTKVVPVMPSPDAWVGQVTAAGLPEAAAKDLANMSIYHEKVGMTSRRPLEETRAVYPHVLSLEAGLERHKPAFLEALA